MLAVALVLGVLAAAATAAAIFVPRMHADGAGRPIDVDIPAGAGDDDVTARLVSAGVVTSPRLFGMYVSAIGGLHAAPGRHLLADDLSHAELVRRLRRNGEASKIKVTLPEGWNRFDMARRLREKRICDDGAFLAATTERAILDQFGIAAPSAEGWLFPATYSLPADADAREVARTLLGEGKKRVDALMKQNEAGVLELQQTLGFGAGQIVTLASIVEKEAVVDDERPIIASVFLNRLRDPSFVPHLLQADPTASYGCFAAALPSPACATWVAEKTTKPSAEIEHDEANAWSTYTHEGLPPTPIASPGEKSLRAVLAPSKTRFLYFVAKGGGRHTFSETLEKHNEAVAPK